MEFVQTSRPSRKDPFSEAMFFVDKHCRILHANEGADAFLNAGDVLQAHDGCLNFIDTSVNVKLQKAVSALDFTNDKITHLEEPISIDGPDLKNTYSASIAPYCSAMPTAHPEPAVALINIQNLKTIKAQELVVFQERLNFTPAEAKLAREMLMGDGREAAARRCGISVNTARTHLTRIFEKTRVTRQAELLRVLYNVAKNQF